ncbi:hypothetical protein [Photobacterium angustum]|uniref:Uncharacterized protein n=1 Tax=Photobacterium angustum TaxID=661 RepID=A0A2S7VZG9_PHOAN|nr:hypothetical protein [Photobacterium angustum]PQJ67143.1 hypothetical protein BTO08_06885 [Photobacterium angustum]
MVSSGVHIRDESLLSYRSLLLSWIECIQDYISVWDGDDLPYWYNERANVGILAGAAWRSGMIALEEFQTIKVADDGEDSKGRNDLYLADKSIGAFIEAKVSFPNILNKKQYTNLVKSQLFGALSDVRKIKDEGEKIGVVFVAPYSQSDRANDEDVSKFIEALPSFNVGAIAWCCPNMSQKHSSHDGKYYPVVALLFCRA